MFIYLLSLPLTLYFVYLLRKKDRRIIKKIDNKSKDKSYINFATKLFTLTYMFVCNATNKVNKKTFTCMNTSFNFS